MNNSPKQLEGSLMNFILQVAQDGNICALRSGIHLSMRLEESGLEPRQFALLEQFADQFDDLLAIDDAQLTSTILAEIHKHRRKEICGTESNVQPVISNAGRAWVSVLDLNEAFPASVAV